MNGKELQVERGTTVAALLQKEGFQNPAATVAVNDRVLPRREWHYRLGEGDRVEIIILMDGG
ncbi:MAG: sulfur carrier protein ThiS [Moorella sp. (in: firmicutes)]|nr:sulfur carrier protein ThiS [Moorella humiferrea]